MNKFFVKFILIGAMAFLNSNALGWNSALFSTHAKITKKAVELMDKRAYSDIERVCELIKKGASSEKSHEANDRRGGKVKDWWFGAGRDTLMGGVLPNYYELNFKPAYENLGKILHLTQDQAVPSHAANIPHGIPRYFPGDGLEIYAISHYKPGIIPLIDSSDMPFNYYQELQNDTRSRLSSWVNPKTNIPYWNLSENAPIMGEDLTFGPIGHYGGGKDTYFKRAEVKDYKSDVDEMDGNKKYKHVISNPEICERQLAMAVGYTKAVLESASKKLPPLVSNLKVYPNVLSPGQEADISFMALENRSDKVSYEVIVSRVGLKPETVFFGVIKLNQPKRDEYLFKKRLILKWDGLLSGKEIEEGSYTIEVKLVDEDGNTIPDDVNADSLLRNDSKINISVASEADSDISDSFSFDGN